MFLEYYLLARAKTSNRNDLERLVLSLNTLHDEEGNVEEIREERAKGRGSLPDWLELLIGPNKKGTVDPADEKGALDP